MQGTTYTGVGYITGANPGRDISIISRWGRGQLGMPNCLKLIGLADHSSAFQDKVPSVLGYALDNADYGGEDRWGYQIKPGDVSYAWWKLLLDNDCEPQKWDDPELRKVVGNGVVRLPQGKSAQEVATDYLRFIHKHIFAQLRELLGAAGLDLTPIDWALTVPATWSHKARNASRKAAVDAGFGKRKGDDLLVIDEPQAGILEVLYSAINKYEQGVQPYKKGSTITSCDLGGGTSDLISYRISKLNPLRLEEAAVGVG
jgi:molecular chaperone DnaK (HSP70)